MDPSLKPPSLIAPGLYLIGTPIGNLEDISFRAIRILKGMDLIAAEDTRQTLKLLRHFNIEPPSLISCFKHNELQKISSIHTILRQGGRVAVVTDAGMPTISDPGLHIVQWAIENHIPIIPIPGPSAVLTALAVSGFPTQPFAFFGFLPTKSPERVRELSKIKLDEKTLVFFEAPHRIKNCLKDMLNVFGNRLAVVARELTKIHEEWIRNRLEQIWNHFKENEPRGEFTIVVQGAEIVSRAIYEKWAGVSIEDQLKYLIYTQGVSKTEAVKEVCKLRDLPRDVVYRIAAEMKWKKDETQPGVENI